ncbi:MAG: phosphoribosylformylglycinamidine synthase [Oscillospiraceae bacterium]|nr:phosphoribosylformylglycinamidine synthase [Oscillospiraceae bacterium]
MERFYVEKRPNFDIAAVAVQNELSEVLSLPELKIRLLNVYYVEHLAAENRHAVVNTVLSEPMCDICYEGEPPEFPDDTRLLFVESLPGQYDVRADSCEQCIQMLCGGERPTIKTARLYAISGVTQEQYEKVKSYLINPLEERELESAIDSSPKAQEIPASELLQTDFINIPCESELETFRVGMGFAMSLDDLSVTQAYFKSIKRNPTITELKVIDTYWSDHCRHTTFNTVIEAVDIADERVKKAYDLFLKTNGSRPVTLMNIAVAAMRHLKKKGKLPMLFEPVSKENNACTIKVGNSLVFFKNETHNHPTEIEPFGGASTCIGGAIRDPLSGRAYVYQAMRISGAGDPYTSIENTLTGKLLQRKLTVTAAEGFSSYGNQIGLATGFVKEIYHEGYLAKRLETGAVVGAVRADSVIHELPCEPDVVVLLGGRTGRDGIGGATGSSKTHGVQTVSDCAAEVQKGNPPEERKLQRLFRNRDVTRLIKKCNDFGAGGAAVAVGELAAGVEINLDAFPLKYDGLNGTEIAVSESQERMAVVVSKENLPRLLRHAEEENIEATVIARITKEPRLVMVWRGEKIVDIERCFLDTNGAQRFADVFVPNREGEISGCAKGMLSKLTDCSQKGLVERFDSSIGAGSVFMPFGGKEQQTQNTVMAAIIPGETDVATVMAYGFEPYLTNADPFGGAFFAVVVSVVKLIAAGVEIDTIHLSLQEYFKSVRDCPQRWGDVFAAMLGAFAAQMSIGVAAIGGKDSMSGSFGDLDVPSTLISFALGIAEPKTLVSTEFKAVGNPVYLLETPPDMSSVKPLWKKYLQLVKSGKVLSAGVNEIGVYECIRNMALGNVIGFVGDTDIDCPPASIIFEAVEELDGYTLLGRTQQKPEINGISLKQIKQELEAPLEKIFPLNAKRKSPTGDSSKAQLAHEQLTPKAQVQPASEPLQIKQTYSRFEKTPVGVIPVFPGTNCEYDTAMALERAGGVSNSVLIRNLSPSMLSESVVALEKAIKSAQMLIFPGGFSGGDEPDGAAKFIVSLFRNPRLTDAVHELLERDGLILGICNGFQALVKLGLLPFGRISDMTEHCPTLTFNSIGRHQAKYVRTRVACCASPWLSECKTGEVYLQPISHGEGRFTASDEVLASLEANSQIAFQYVDYNAKPTMEIEHNPNGAVWAIEGITSRDGRILGKMAHTERYSEFVAKNIPGNKFMLLFEGGVKYFS